MPNLMNGMKRRMVTTFDVAGMPRTLEMQRVIDFRISQAKRLELTAERLNVSVPELIDRYIEDGLNASAEIHRLCCDSPVLKPRKCSTFTRTLDMLGL